MCAGSWSAGGEEGPARPVERERESRRDPALAKRLKPSSGQICTPHKQDYSLVLYKQSQKILSHSQYQLPYRWLPSFGCPSLCTHCLVSFPHWWEREPPEQGSGPWECRYDLSLLSVRPIIAHALCPDRFLQPLLQPLVVFICRLTCNLKILGFSLKHRLYELQN